MKGFLICVSCVGSSNFVRLQEHKAAETSSKSSKIFFKPHGRRGEVLDRMNYESPETAKVVKRSVWTTEDLNASMTAYRAACRGARIAIEEHLRKLSLDLKVHTCSFTCVHSSL